ncbi:exosporium protein D [Bacillus cereus]|uniref:exosporium protein D n=1 Tax=Bacillus cereus TaxID=1396 RepID=UPI000BF6E79B|nr:exosporium protein D [Bacillus cereus]PER99189.1 exosporium protein D [Bacillus cereus]
MSNYFYKHGKKCYKNHSHSLPQNNNCFVETHTIAGSGTNLTGNVPINIFLEDGAIQTVFEDFTNNHNKTLLQLSSIPTPATGGTAPAQPLEVTIRTKNSRTPIIARIPGSPGGTTQGGTRIFQVENFESLTVSNLGTSFGTLSTFIQKTFCICCNASNVPCDEYYCEENHDC